ncbi:MAG: Coenzyme F420 hydrogenase/dehydrogenase, beta subunit C-terminal domain [Aestuariivita sp.]|nr:Coenzyme F420 hydrogenase/dehydrogenase, beta subunit C-terminal domain [Aestuariivita sp.]
MNYKISEPVPRSLCTDCGLSRSKNPERCGRACQFISPDYSALELSVHGRQIQPERGDTRFFGPYHRMYKAWAHKPFHNAQWSGLTTLIAENLLDDGSVDAVLTVVSDENDRWRPVPALITTAGDMTRARGMKMGYAPLLALLEPARSNGIKRVAVIGIPCQVYALRAIESELSFDRLYVIGTPCSDNTTTDNFHKFLAKLTDRPNLVNYFEFRADYQVEIRFDDGQQKLIPFLKLPLSDLPSDFFPLTCRTCVDYTNRLADITVGYMAGDGEQWLIIRNDQGAELLERIRHQINLKPVESRGRRKNAVKGFIENTARAAGGLPLRRMPDWIRPLMAWLQPKIGPRGLEFARARVEMKAAETILHLRRVHPKRLKYMVPNYIWKLVAPYAILPNKETEIQNK